MFTHVEVLHKTAVSRRVNTTEVTEVTSSRLFLCFISIAVTTFGVKTQRHVSDV